MAKKQSSTKKSSAASSSKTVKSSSLGKSSVKAASRKTPASSVKITKTTVKKAPVKAKSSGRVSYKQEYIKLLQKTNKTLNKEIKSIRKAIEEPEFKATRKPIVYEPTTEEAFPREPKRPTPTPQPAKSIEQQILEQLQDIELQIRSRDMAFEDLVSGSAKLGGGLYGQED